MPKLILSATAHVLGSSADCGIGRGCARLLAASTPCVKLRALISELLMPRGRKPAAASFTVVPLVPGAGRPDPPAGLDGVEKRIWTAIVGSLPDHWIDAAGEQILRRGSASVRSRTTRGQAARAAGARSDRDDEVTASSKSIIGRLRRASGICSACCAPHRDPGR